MSWILTISCYSNGIWLGNFLPWLLIEWSRPSISDHLNTEQVKVHYSDKFAFQMFAIQIPIVKYLLKKVFHSLILATPSNTSLKVHFTTFKYQTTYNEDLNSKLVRYSIGPKQFVRRMVRLVFRSPLYSVIQIFTICTVQNSSWLPSELWTHLSILIGWPQI